MLNWDHRASFLKQEQKKLLDIANLPDTLQKMTNSLLVNVDIPIPKDYSGLMYPCKIDLVTSKEKQGEVTEILSSLKYLKKTHQN